MKSAVTISLVGGSGRPFVFWNDDLATACAKAANFGFDAVEIFPPQAWGFEVDILHQSLKDHRLAVAAMGTGAGWIKHQLSLSSVNAETRERAVDFVAAIIDCAAEFNAPAIIGSMQGGVAASLDDGHRSTALSHLKDSLEQLAPLAERKGQILLIEPLNRYETRLLQTVQDGLELLGSLRAKNVRLLLDAFHMNIEEQNIAQAIRLAGPAIGHFHFADSNRRAAGFGHTDFRPIIWALRDIRYTGYLSAEILPWPSSEAAAAQTMESFKTLFV